MAATRKHDLCESEYDVANVQVEVIMSRSCSAVLSSLIIEIIRSKA